MKIGNRIKHFCLLTDFGAMDSYVAEMKGRLYSSLPDAIVIDLTHEIEPQNVLQAMFFLERVWNYWTLPSIHIAVVDPGVGTDRKILVVKEQNKYLICPDNGLATPILSKDGVEIRELYIEKVPDVSNISKTFHGRDIMVPAGVAIAKGINWTTISRETREIKKLEFSQPIISGNTIIGEIIYIDKFGNAITNISNSLIGAMKVEYTKILNRKIKIPFVSTYAEVEIGKPLCLFGSSNRLEIAINCGSAKEKLKLDIGSKIEIRLKKN